MYNPTEKGLSCRRYTDVPFPSYRFIPGESPHPRRERHGHSFGQPEPSPGRFPPSHWCTSREYLLGIDLFNGGYWWESHEQFEALWHAFGRHTPEGFFFKGLIQLAAACIKREMNNPAAASRLLKNASIALKQAPSHCMGLNTDRLIEDISLIDVAGGEISICLLLEPTEVAPPSTMSGPPET